MWQLAKNKYHLFVSFLANVYYGFPGKKLIIVGVTGTSGKTTTAHMIYEILKSAGFKVSLLSSIKAIIHNKEYDTGFHVTTPDPQTLPKYLRQAIDAGDEYFVLEVSSHALDQNRTAFVRFRVGVLTSLAHEHLDYHKTMLNYAKAKFKLLKGADVPVIPSNLLLSLDKADLEVLHLTLPSPQGEEGTGRFPLPGERIKERGKSLYNKFLSEKRNKIITFGLEKGNETQENWKLKLKMPGDYNISNALAAASVGKILNVSKNIIKNTLESFSAIPGRFEEIKNTKGFRIIIDFAHKPDALEQVLKTARKEVEKKGRIIVMYGCASKRDILKRSIMGRISGQLAEVTVLTDEDPRFEDSMKIINEIAAGCEEAGAKEVQMDNGKLTMENENIFFKIPDRQKAINFIITKLAKKGDIILLCGKGHEQSMNYNGVEKPWNEHEAVKRALDIFLKN